MLVRGAAESAGARRLASVHASDPTALSRSSQQFEDCALDTWRQMFQISIGGDGGSDALALIEVPIDHPSGRRRTLGTRRACSRGGRRPRERPTPSSGSPGDAPGDEGPPGEEWYAWRSPDGRFSTGVWRRVPETGALERTGLHEIALMIDGEVEIGSEDGSMLDVGPSDVLVTPDGTEGIWRAKTAVRKFWAVARISAVPTIDVQRTCRSLGLSSRSLRRALSFAPRTSRRSWRWMTS